MKPPGLRSAAGTPLQVIGSIRLATQVEQRVTNTNLLVVKNLAVKVPLGRAFIDVNIKSISPGKQLIYPIISSHVPITGTAHEVKPTATVDTVEEQQAICRFAQPRVLLALTQAPVVA